MSEKTIESYGKGFLVLLLPISFLIIFLVATWKIWLAGILLVLFFNLWQYYKWQKWCVEVNPIFNQLVRENQGKITPIDLAIKGNFSGEKAKRYLLNKAREFGASALGSENDGQVYYFMTASALGSILDSSEPPKELPPHPVASVLPLLEPPELKHEQEQEQEQETESPPPQTTYEEVKQPLEKQLVFGSLIQSELAKRLNVYSSTVYKRREDPDFPEWSRGKDPDGIAWAYSRKTKEFFPQEDKKS
ncbi:hypothetical protein G7B40_014830 [Aetokthonos hydrillicola Thurmond2011]|uniref:Uncharacterized protein n=1 Tax=Aetokthonos hydrillicola Thurmond2011 TaxID=2712845 RepID=A0AAP5I9S8_9CYAN|nr:hypothetical protein [Aetokthonos hydrillicola]MBO3461379.1 hypothetical protein [Aetokthonos hydrillicola CCALA 1050]MBW4586815.1 hypothetical protein [Aetokthonos hydrillicola CCALA 1050]MDR9895828.1 hypothetical protein [Aetokthonos hydrillicola Thurmond2011]